MRIETKAESGRRKAETLPPFGFCFSPSAFRFAEGYALAITLLFLAVSLIIFTGIFSWTSSNATVTVRNNQYNMSLNAAEAAVETVLGRIDRDFINSSFTTNAASVYNCLATNIDQSTWPVQYIFSDTNGNSGLVSVNIGAQAGTLSSLSSQYSNLMCYARWIDIYATATPTNEPQIVPATVHESINLANIPLFQFAIFYNVNLEICPGQPMNIGGAVFCNQNIWEGSGNATFSSTVSAVGTNCQLKANPFALNYSPQTPPATFSLAGQPKDHANAITMPIGTNNSPGAILGLLNLPPSDYAMGTAAAYSSNGIVYPANAADLVISNFFWGTNDIGVSPTGTNYVVYFQDQAAQSLTALPYDFYALKTGGSTNWLPIGQYTNIAFAGMSWLTNVAFSDWREGYNGGAGPAKRVEALQINVTNLGIWMTNQAKNGGSDQYGPIPNGGPDPDKFFRTGHHIGSIYVFNSVWPTTSQLPAVRVANGAQLPNPGGLRYGLTVATPFPMYVLGNYNSQDSSGSALGLYGTNGATAHTLPAALMADSITILSGKWDDSKTSSKPDPSDTTVNAAMLEGIVQTVPTISGDYSGGVENFLRLLENWSGHTLTYNGSIVVLFYSQYATNHWNGGYYSVPTRHWAFDLNYQNALKLPPLTPQNRALVRGTWIAHQ